MTALKDIIEFLEKLAPPLLAETWDNVGLLLGAREQNVRRVMTCLTVTPATAAEAIGSHADLIVSHHPIPFQPLKRLTSDTTVGRLLLELASARIAVYSPHTAWDSALEGINQRLALGLSLRGIVPLIPGETSGGAGRSGWLEEVQTLEQLTVRVKTFLGLERLQIVGSPDRPIRTVAVSCGAGGELLEAARAAGCDCMLTGETRFHTCLEAEAWHMALILVGHYASERFSLERLAELLGSRFPNLEVWASRDERDPLVWL